MIALLASVIQLSLTSQHGIDEARMNIVICRKGLIQRTEIERPFLATKSFNSNLVQFLDSCHCIMLLLLLVTCMSTLLCA